MVMKKKSSEVIKMQEFSYQEIWELQEPARRPHDRMSEELGVKVSDIPVSPALTKFGDSLRRMEELYNLSELEEEGVNVTELLNKYTEIHLSSQLHLEKLKRSF
ncbi:hypothetical protein HYX08_03635 [Candidatus Woesearchaeota archaeon]|nr:hypothetical protein [Candidatus Woesearchaeota archaeon]